MGVGDRHCYITPTRCTPGACHVLSVWRSWQSQCKDNGNGVRAWGQEAQSLCHRAAPAHHVNTAEAMPPSWGTAVSGWQGGRGLWGQPSLGGREEGGLRKLARKSEQGDRERDLPRTTPGLRLHAPWLVGRGFACGQHRAGRPEPRGRKAQ